MQVQAAPYGQVLLVIFLKSTLNTESLAFGCTFCDSLLFVELVREDWELLTRERDEYMRATRDDINFARNQNDEA